jgi:hypothetical protein
MSIKILTPQLSLLKEVSDKLLLENFLKENNLVGKSGLIKNQVIAIDFDIQEKLSAITYENTYVISTYIDNNWLLSEFNQNLKKFDRVFFSPKYKDLRHFYNTLGFIKIMKEIEDKLFDSKVFLPAGLYGNKHLFGIEKKLVAKS